MKKRYIKIFVICLLVSTIAVAAQFVPYPTEDFSEDTAYKVLEVVNSNTVTIQYQDKPTTFQLIGTVTRQHNQAYGKEANAFIRNLLLGEYVYLRFDTPKTDKSGNHLAYLYRAPDGLFANLEIVRQGYAQTYAGIPFKHAKIFHTYANKAREAGRGLYAQPNQNAKNVQTGSRKKTAFELALEQTSYKIHAQTITKDYESNAFAADEKYKNKIVLVQSEIDEFSQIGDMMYVKLKPHSAKALPDVFGINCQMQPSQRPYLAQLKKGESVYIIGKVVGMEVLDIKLEDCLIARVPKKE